MMRVSVAWSNLVGAGMIFAGIAVKDLDPSTRNMCIAFGVGLIGFGQGAKAVQKRAEVGK
jgi:hypothetical protein